MIQTCSEVPGSRSVTYVSPSSDEGLRKDCRGQYVVQASKKMLCFFSPLSCKILCDLSQVRGASRESIRIGVLFQRCNWHFSLRAACLLLAKFCLHRTAADYSKNDLGKLDMDMLFGLWVDSWGWWMTDDCLEKSKCWRLAVRIPYQQGQERDVCTGASSAPTVVRHGSSFGEHHGSLREKIKMFLACSESAAHPVHQYHFFPIIKSLSFVLHYRAECKCELRVGFKPCSFANIWRVGQMIFWISTLPVNLVIILKVGWNGECRHGDLASRGRALAFPSTVPGI